MNPHPIALAATAIAVAGLLWLRRWSRTDTGLPNWPPPETWGNLWRLAGVANHFGGRAYVTSAYRSPAVNAAVGGVHGSAHLAGRALDLVPVDGVTFADLHLDAQILLDSGAVSRVLYEGDHLHLELPA